MAGRPVVFDFIARDRNYTGPVDKMERRTVHFGATMGRIGGVAVKAFGGFGVAAAGAAVAAVGLGLKTEAANEQAAISFKHLLGGAKQADRFLKGLIKFAAETPFELPGVEQAAQLLLGAGEDARKILPDLRAIGDAASTTTNPVDALNATVIALSRSMSMGKIQLGEVSMAVESGVPLWKLLSEATGKPIPKLQDMASKGKLLTKDVLPKLYDQMHKDYGGAMAEQSTTLSGLWSTFKDTISQSLAGAMVPLADMLKHILPAAGQVFQTAVKDVSDFITGTVIPGLQNAKTWWDHNKDSVSTLATVIKTQLVPSMGSIPGAGDKDVAALGSVKGALDRLKWAVELTIEDFLHFKLGMITVQQDIIHVGRGVYEWLIKPFGYFLEHVLGFFDSTIRHAGQAIERFADKSLQKADDKLIDLNRSAGDARAAIAALHGKTIPIKAQTDVEITKSVSDYLKAANVPGFRAEGAIVRGPELAMVGEGRAPETIIPWDPQYRTRALDLWTTTGRQLGVPGFARGGTVGTRLRHRFYNPTIAETRRIGISEGMVAAAAMQQLVTSFGGFGGGAASGNVIGLALAQAKRMAASFKVALALIEAGIVESGLRNLPYGDRDSLGFLQQRPSQGWLHPMNISYAAWDFLRRAIPIQGKYGTAGMLAQAVQRSAFPGRYDQHQAQALGILNAYGYDRGGMLPVGASVAVNNTGKPEPVGAAAEPGPVTVHVHVAGSLIGSSPQQIATVLAPHIEQAFLMRYRLAPLSRMGPRR
jgi:tape measure domain-containing protein